MSTYNFNSTVSSQEADALKEMIFKRARERAQALVQDVQENYTTGMQNDIMDLARDSFNIAKNPFSENDRAVENKDTETNSREIGFAKRQVNGIKAQIETTNKITRTDIAGKEIENAMNVAREDFDRKKSFTGALDFLNSQATIALIKNKGQKFEALA